MPRICVALSQLAGRIALKVTLMTQLIPARGAVAAAESAKSAAGLRGLAQKAASVRGKERHRGMRPTESGQRLQDGRAKPGCGVRLRPDLDRLA